MNPEYLDHTNSEPFNARTGCENTSLVSVRVSFHNYLTALLFGSFFSALLFYLEFDLAGMILFGFSSILIPSLALGDRVRFDGRRIIRTGFLPVLWSRTTSARNSLKLSDIEQVETLTHRTIKRGESITYRYKTVIRGKGISIALASGNDGYLQMLSAILQSLAENVLDARSVELKDHLRDPKETLMRAEFSRIPAADVLRGSFRKVGRENKKRFSHTVSMEEEEKVDDLHSLGNQLRVSGYLFQALEAFRRALVLRPTDARLLFDFARCLYSFAGAEKDNKLERRALAALRLSERRASADPELLIRLGEWYSHIGEWRRAGSVFQNVLDTVGENFRTARALAEIALREGKIAHVIHHFSTANRLADTSSLRRWSRSEAEYFSNLNSDAEYMDLEIGRVNMLETVETSQRTTLRIALYSFPLIVTGVYFGDETVANIGWAVSAISLIVWGGLIFLNRMLAPRIPYDLVESEDDY
jgi:tetratricopeptide (TPR) repeat protein